MKNILLIHDYPLQEGGGVEIQTYNDAIALTQRGFSVCIASSRASSETYHGGKSVYPQTTNQSVELDVINCLQALRERIIDADIVHIQATFSMRPAMMYAMKICISLNKKYIVTLHTNSSHIPFSALSQVSAFEKDILLEEFKTLIESNLCTVFGVSQSVSQSLSVLGIKKDFEIVYNAKDWNTFVVQKESLDTVDITYVGEVSWMKGMHVFIGALTLLAKDKPNLSVRIIGGGQDKKEIQTLIQSLDLSRNVSFVSYVENKKLPIYLQSTSILVQPSLSETWGNIVMEAIVCGATVVVSDTEGLPELVENGKIGDVFERGNVFDLYKKLLFRLQDPIPESEKRKRSKYIQSMYSMNTRIHHLVTLYRKTHSGVIKTRKKKDLIEFCPKID
jgi:glycosyltransferase involved in cell wall biosynthesis